MALTSLYHAMPLETAFVVLPAAAATGAKLALGCFVAAWVAIAAYSTTSSGQFPAAEEMEAVSQKEDEEVEGEARKREQSIQRSRSAPPISSTRSVGATKEAAIRFLAAVSPNAASPKARDRKIAQMLPRWYAEAAVAVDRSCAAFDRASNDHVVGHPGWLEAATMALRGEALSPVSALIASHLLLSLLKSSRGPFLNMVLQAFDKTQKTSDKATTNHAARLELRAAYLAATAYVEATVSSDAKETSPSLVISVSDLVRVHRSASRVPHMIGVLTAASQVETNNPLLLYCLADCCKKSGDLEGACLSYEQASFLYSRDSVDWAECIAAVFMIHHLYDVRIALPTWWNDRSLLSLYAQVLAIYARIRQAPRTHRPWFFRASVLRAGADASWLAGPRSYDDACEAREAQRTLEARLKSDGRKLPNSKARVLKRYKLWLRSDF